MRLKTFAILLILIMAAPLVTARDRIVKVGLLDDINKVSIKAKEGIRVLSDEVKPLLLAENIEYDFKWDENFIIVNDNYFTAPSLLIWPARQGNLLSVNGRKYRGYIEISKDAEGLTVVNHVNFSNYLASVVGSEINSNWPLEVLKAQAVVARTYALRNMGSHLSRGYNLSSTVSSQAYKGVSCESERTIRAVYDTKGEVIIYNGDLISAVYHSTAGGQTAKGAVIWGSDLPYLQSVISFDDRSPYYSWQKEYSKEEIEKILIDKKINIEQLKGIALKDRGPSGRPKTIIIEDSMGSIYKVDSSKFRFWLGLRSTRFTITKAIPISFNCGRNSYSKDLAGVRYFFTGYGWGHGVGMSQWGAYQLAKEGFDYQEILQHYYIGTRIIIADGGVEDEG